MHAEIDVSACKVRFWRRVYETYAAFFVAQSYVWQLAVQKGMAVPERKLWTSVGVDTKFAVSDRQSVLCWEPRYPQETAS